MPGFQGLLMQWVGLNEAKPKEVNPDWAFLFELERNLASAEEFKLGRRVKLFTLLANRYFFTSFLILTKLLSVSTLSK